MTAPDYGIIRGMKYENAPAQFAPAGGVSQEVSAPMPDKSTPNSTTESISKNRAPYWSDCHQCYMIPLTQGMTAKVGPSDISLVAPYKWYAGRDHGTYYALRKVQLGRTQKTLSMHRVISGAKPGEIVDHINGDGLDNRSDNLRICTNAENIRNFRSRPIHNTSGYVGVTFSKSAKKWQSQIKRDGKNIYIGVFDDPIDAAIARDIAAIELHGEYASLNFPHLREVFGGEA